MRTIAQGEARYNPMSYHNGSIWPHDNALAAMGLARYGMKEHTARLATALYEASLFMDLHRLPELFCGFERRNQGEGPTLYDRLRLVDLRVGDAVVDVQFDRHGAEIGVQVTRKQGEVEVSVVL